MEHIVVDINKIERDHIGYPMYSPFPPELVDIIDEFVGSETVYVRRNIYDDYIITLPDREVNASKSRIMTRVGHTSMLYLYENNFGSQDLMPAICRVLKGRRVLARDMAFDDYHPITCNVLIVLLSLFTLGFICFCAIKYGIHAKDANAVMLLVLECLLGSLAVLVIVLEVCLHAKMMYYHSHGQDTPYERDLRSACFKPPVGEDV